MLPPLFANLSANLANFVVVPPVIDLSSCIRHQGPSEAYWLEINPLYLFRPSALHLQLLLHEIFVSQDQLNAGKCRTDMDYWRQQRLIMEMGHAQRE